MEPRLPALGAWSLTHWSTRKVPPSPRLLQLDSINLLTHFPGGSNAKVLQCRSSVQSLNRVWLFVTPFPVNCSMPGFPVVHQLLELAQTRVHSVGDAIQPSHPLLSPSPPAFNLRQHQSFPMSQFFASSGPSIGASASASVLPMNIQDWFPLGLTGLILQSKGLSKIFFWSAEEPGSTLGQEDSLGEGTGNSLQYSCLENSMDLGTWQATVHGVAKCWTQLRD